jgi:hypothetical protein
VSPEPPASLRLPISGRLARSAALSIFVPFLLMITSGGLAAQTGDIRPAAANPEESAGGPRAQGAAPASSISFTDSSSGLDKLGWEIGSTEWEMFDWTGDGHADLLTIGDHGSPKLNSQQGGLMVFSGDGVGAWTVRQEGGTDWGYGGLAVRKGGVIAGMHHNNAQSGCGSRILDACLGEMGAGLGSAGETYGMFGVDYGDFDNDGDLDIGASSFGYGNGLQVYRRDAQTWVNVGISKAGNVDNFFEWADIDADGNLDAISGADIGKVTLGDGKGGWKRSDTGVPPEAWRLSAGDLNDDGYQDISYIADGPQNETIPRVSLFEPSSGGWKDASASIIASLDLSKTAEKSWQFTGITDADADGELDVIAAGRVGLAVFKGDGRGSFTRAYTYQTSEMVWWYAFETGVDVDWDGLPDVIGLYERETGKRNEAHFLRSGGGGATQGVVTYPRGGERFYPGSVRTVRWLAQGSTASIELSTTGSSGPWTPIGGGSNDGQFDWKVPATPSKNCYLKLTAGSHSWVTQRPFEIIGSSGPAPLVASVSAPNGGENLSAGSTFDIKFEVAGGALPATGTLELSTAGPSGPWSKIADVANAQSGTNTHAWAVPNSPTATGYVRLNLKDSSPTPQTASDSSNGAFAIWSPPVPTLARAEVTPATASLEVGKSATFSAKAFDSAGSEMAGATFSWGLVGSVGTLTPSGAQATLGATTAGTATVEVTATEGGISRTATASVEVRDSPKPVLAKVVIEPASVSGKVGEVVTLKATAIDAQGKLVVDATYEWSVAGGVGSLDATSAREVRLTLSAAGSGELSVKAVYEGAEKQATAKVSVRQTFAIPWELILITAICLAAVIGIAGAAVGYRRRKRRDEERRRDEWTYRQEGWQGNSGQGWQ